MAETVNVKNTGLRGITVADTKVSFIDGGEGILIYRGYRIEELAGSSSFMEVAHLIVNGSLPDTQALRGFEDRIVQARPLPEWVLSALRSLPRNGASMDVLQAMVPLLAMDDPELTDESRPANVNKAIRLIARIPAVVAAWHRIRQGLEPLQPDETLSHAANFLWQLHGEKPDQEMARDLDVCLTLHADHTFNASTFSCRQVASTQAHLYAAVAAGIGALSGPLHGGANARVMQMLLDLEGEEDIPGWIQRTLDSGGKIMGLGHAVYKAMDPRANYLKEMLIRLGRKTGQQQWIHLSQEIEKHGQEAFAARGKQGIYPNVDFFSGPVYFLMGLPLDLMTPLFAISRITGWCAHVIEEKFGEAQGKPALYRPKAEYVGNYCGLMGCEFVPLDKRQ